jgi:hypothetical protein
MLCLPTSKGDCKLKIDRFKDGPFKQKILAHTHISDHENIVHIVVIIRSDIYPASTGQRPHETRNENEGRPR